MLKILIKQLFTIWLFLLLPFLGIVTRVNAEEIVISGNGSNSSSEVSSTVNTETSTTQTNQANITNNIDVNANSGGNDASQNSGGETSISTGNVNVDTSITNSGNVSNVDLNCCPSSGGNITISNNADGSTNSVNNNITTATNVTINQTAQIDNIVGVFANSGNNTTSNNSGDVLIKTGNVGVLTGINNTGINNYSVNVPVGLANDFSLKISGNGVNSTNIINHNVNQDFIVLINNIASINNLLNLEANSGGNTANNNGGDVKIITGDVYLATIINNTDINKGTVEFDCCEQEETPPPCTTDCPSAPCETNCNPSSNPSNGGGGGGGGGSSSGGGGGSVAGAATSGQILPVTGSYWVIILTLFSAIMFALGLYLRRHPGQDPGKMYIYC